VVARFQKTQNLELNQSFGVNYTYGLRE